MLNENIKRFRKEQKISQDELAVRLHVVRQTVSKWENGLSVPDAEVLVQMAEILEVSVSQLLGVEMKADEAEGSAAEQENAAIKSADKTAMAELSEELARVNALLAEKNRKGKLLLEANKKRGIMILLSFVALMIAVCVQKEAVSAILSGLCMLAAVLVLYRNMALLSSVTNAENSVADSSTGKMRLGALRLTTVFTIVVLIGTMVFAALTAADLINFSENGEKMFAMALASIGIIFIGLISPKLPFNRHVGLRLPWTVQDEDTWNLAHRILGYISLPIALLYIGCACTMADFEMVTAAAFILWIGVPGVISGVFYYKKWHN